MTIIPWSCRKLHRDLEGWMVHNMLCRAQAYEVLHDGETTPQPSGLLLYIERLLQMKATGSSETPVYSSWNVMAHGDAREWKWRGNWRMEWVASTLHTTSEHAVSSITTADAHTSAASRLNWSLRRFKWTRPFRRRRKSVFCECAVTFQLVCTTN